MIDSSALIQFVYSLFETTAYWLSIAFTLKVLFHFIFQFRASKGKR